MKKLFQLILLCSFSSHFCLNAEDFSGMLRIDTPSADWEWYLMNYAENDGIKAWHYACTKGMVGNQIVMSVAEIERVSDWDREVWFAGQYNGAVKTLIRHGFKVVDARRPEPDEIKNLKEVIFEIDCIAPDGSKVFTKSICIFLKNTYSIQVYADSKKEAERLFEIRKSLEEK